MGIRCGGIGTTGPLGLLHVKATDGTNFVINSTSGNVGIGTTSPTQLLHVQGNFYATGQFTGSSIELKKDISYLNSADYARILDTVCQLKLAQSRYKPQSEAEPETLGVIAEDSPAEILASDRKSVNNTTYITYCLAAIKAQQEEIEALKVKVKELEAKVEEREKR